MGFYYKYIYPRLMDWVFRETGNLRKAALTHAYGEVLEIGFGTGLNLPHYPTDVHSLTALDPLDALRSRVERRIAMAPFPVQHINLPADKRLPFEDARFDCIVTTWTLCSVPDPVAVLMEVRRVIHPKGLYLFLEHGLSADKKIARWQRILKPIQKMIACGCRSDLQVDEIIRQVGFEIVNLRRFVRTDAARIMAEMYEGIAQAPSFK